jgi:hypothetical protein
MIPKPKDVDQLAPITEGLDAADHDARVAWVRSLNGPQQYRLFELAKGNPVSVADLVRGPDVVVRHIGRNGLMLFNKFEKRFARHGEAVVGYNHGEVPGFVAPIYRIFTGHGHFLAYDAPDVPGEVWIDYRKVADTVPPAFPPVAGNESGLPALVFGDMVDVLRRVSRDVFVGDSFKAKYPRPSESPRAPLLARIGGMFPTAPFVVCQEPVSPAPATT